ncbi:MAG: MotA/TolQ/ExbB proton channel family protein [Oscillospiraceae bacterium]|nr:MotA/TolQ/ExbB proton channel family protein [Oscillospiraceae bacterium]
MKINLTFIIGFVLCWAMIVYGVASNQGGMSNLPAFINVPSFFIVVAGTLAALVTSYPLSVLAKMPKYLMLAVMPPKYDPHDYIRQITEFATVARSKGLLALEDGASKCEDPFLKHAVMLIVDANDPDKVREMLEDSIDFTTERHSVAWGFCERGAALAPAFGMMGTVIGLVIMLKNIGGDAASLGQAMAVAFITTFYGSLLANILLMPWRQQMKNVHDDEILCKKLIVEGVMSIAAGSNPRLIQEKLEFMLPKLKASVKNEAK